MSENADECIASTGPASTTVHSEPRQIPKIAGQSQDLAAHIVVNRRVSDVADGAPILARVDEGRR